MDCTCSICSLCTKSCYDHDWCSCDTHCFECDMAHKNGFCYRCNKNTLKPVPSVIAISGWKGSGKDTIADYLVKHGKHVERIGIADTLKNGVAHQYKVDRKKMDDPGEKEKPLLEYPLKVTTLALQAFFHSNKDVFRKADGTKSTKDDEDQLYWTPRALCIFEGLNKRAVDPDYWIKQVIRTVQTPGPVHTYVISDLRFENEAIHLKAVNAKLVRVNRFDTTDSQDSSERELDEYTAFDHVIQNKGSIEELHAQLGSLL